MLVYLVLFHLFSMQKINETYVALENRIIKMHSHLNGELCDMPQNMPYYQQLVIKLILFSVKNWWKVL